MRKTSRKRPFQTVSPLLTALTALAASLAPGCAAQAQQAGVRSKSPNIIVIMFDDFSPRMNAYGDRVAVTPSLDQFSHDAIQFNHAYSTAPVCSPSRAAMMTGQYQWTIGAMHHRTRGLAGGNGGAKIAYETVPPLPTKSFTELLRSRGYATYRTGKADYQFGEPLPKMIIVGTCSIRSKTAPSLRGSISITPMRAICGQPCQSGMYRSTGRHI